MRLSELILPTTRTWLSKSNSKRTIKSKGITIIANKAFPRQLHWEIEFCANAMPASWIPPACHPKHCPKLKRNTSCTSSRIKNSIFFFLKKNLNSWLNPSNSVKFGNNLRSCNPLKIWIFVQKFTSCSIHSWLNPSLNSFCIRSLRFLAQVV